MPAAWTIKSSWQMLALGGLLLSLLAGGLLLARPWPVWRAKAQRLANTVLPALKKKARVGKYASSDRFLAALEVDQPSETIVALMAELTPAETAVLVVPADDPFFSQLFLTFSYLSWPHQIAVLGCKANSAPQIFYQPRPGGSVVRAFFYLQPPPLRLAETSRALSPKLKMIQMARGEDWTSYCSQ